MIKMFEQIIMSAVESVVTLFIGMILILALFGAIWVRNGCYK